MALIVSSQLKALAEDIVPAAPPSASAEQLAARNAAVANTEALVTKVCQYLVDQLEIKGVQVTTGTLHAAATPTVTPQDGGVTLYNSQLKPDVNNQTLSQNNDGKGLIE